MNRRKDKVRTGVALDKYIVAELDDIVSESLDLGLTRSEVINAVLHGFLKSDVEHKKKVEKIRGYIIKMRKGMFSILF